MLKGKPANVYLSYYANDEKGKILIFLLFAILFITFFPCLSDGVVFWDDPDYLFVNKHLDEIGAGWSWTSIMHIFTSDVGANYNPLPIFTYAIEKYFFSTDPVASTLIYHLDNVLLHIATTIAVFVLFMKMGMNKNAAFLGALLSGIHPMRVESVAWITERKDVLYGLFYVLALIAYVNYIKSDDKKRKWYLYAVLLSLLAYFSKVQTVSLPLSMIAVDIYFKRKWYHYKTLIIEKLPWWMFSAAFGLINVYFLHKFSVLNNDLTASHYTPIGKLVSAGYAYSVYVAKFIYPYKMVAYYPFIEHLTWPYYLNLILLAAGIPLLIWKKHKDTALMFGLLFFTFNIMFLLQIVSAGRAYCADRFTYIAYIGLFFIVATCYQRLGGRLKQWAAALFTLYIALFMVISFNQCKVWKNTIALWQHYIDEDEDDSFGYAQIGGALPKHDSNHQQKQHR